MLRVAWISLALLIPLVSPSVASAGPIAVVDVQKVMNSTQHWKDVVQFLEKQRVTRQTDLELKQKTLKERKDKLDAARAVSAPAAIQADEEKLMLDAQQLGQVYMQSQQELTQLEKRATDMMLTRVETLVRELATQADYAFVFEMGTPDAPNVLYSAANIDISDQVIQLYDKYFKDKPIELK